MTTVRATLSDAQGNRLDVQFNPQSLTITHRTTGEEGQLRPTAESERGGEAPAGQASVRTGYSATLSSLELLFDTSDSGEDVRNKTLVIAAMTRPVENKSPLVTFQWGTLIFEGHITGFTETLSYFSDQGVPLRATVNLNMTAAAADRASGELSGANAGLGAAASAGLSAGASVSGSIGASVSAGLSTGASVGTTPLTFAQGDESLQSMAARAGADWRAVAEANKIDNPRTIQAGAAVNMNVGSS
ncbi:MAG: LysM peptidoglycan-binding domain-containing protein [Candidatus Promineifilaceae bacterium]|nr:LysM peptidoglycan-binding domain-containing protein [Candidatus Promineifilaceae bacterium]